MNPASQTGRWALLERAMKIDRLAALESTSWGIGQVMGGHWKWLGYPDVDALVAEARSGAAGQLRLMLYYIEKAGLASALIEHSWSRFALGYNGPGAIRKGYDRKLAAACDHWKNTDLAATHPPAPAPSVLKPGANGPEVTALQDLLTARGFPGGTMGLFDEATESAMKAFQQQSGIKVDGIAGPETMAALSGTSSFTSLRRKFFSWFFQKAKI